MTDIMADPMEPGEVVATASATLTGTTETVPAGYWTIIDEVT